MQLSKILLALPAAFTLVTAAASPNPFAAPFAAPFPQFDITPEQVQCVAQKCELFTNRIVECVEAHDLEKDGMGYAKCICTGDFKSTFPTCLDCYTGSSKTSLKSQYNDLCKSVGVNLFSAAPNGKGLCGSGWVGLVAAGAVVGGLAL
ncbi:hypothetical protein DFH27DRAFT_652506 [Peziza echinospora]|nr:hypothetical protein DFH27DRAFT_652506 [Peziza echinospora]